MRPCLALITLLLATSCQKEGPSISQKLEAQAQEEARKKQAQEEAIAQQKKARDAMVPKLMEARRPVDTLYARVYQAIPETRTLVRKECPDKQILADTPDEASRVALLLNKESVYLLSGQADAREGKMDTYHTPAVDHALALRRASGKETPLLDRAPGDTSEKIQAQIDAASFVQRFRYVAVAVFSAYYPADVRATPRPKPARVEGWTVLVDSKTGKALCQVESAGEGLVNDGVINTDSAADEEAWAMYLRTAAKNLEAITKVVTLDGAPKKR